MYMRKSAMLFLIVAAMATLISCNRNTKSEPAVYELEVYKTQEILVNAEDRGGVVRRTLPVDLWDINGKDVLVFLANDKEQYYDLETGKKISDVGEPAEATMPLDTNKTFKLQLASGNEKLWTEINPYNENNEVQVSLEYDMTNDVYWGGISYDFQYYGETLHTLVLTDKDLNYLGEIYNAAWPWFSNGRILVNIEPVNDSIVKVNYLKLTKTDRDYKEYIDSCRAALEKKHKDWEEYKENNSPENSPLIGLVKPEADRIYKVLAFYCKDEISDGDKMVIDSLLANKEVVEHAPIYLVVSADNEEAAAAYVKENGLDCFSKIVFDTEGIAKTEAGQANPRFIRVEDGLITTDTVYSTDDLGRKMFPRLFGEGEFTRYYYDEEYGGLIVGVDYNITFDQN